MFINIVWLLQRLAGGQGKRRKFCHAPRRNQKFDNEQTKEESWAQQSVERYARSQVWHGLIEP
jgi:hypothetical protein